MQNQHRGIAISLSPPFGALIPLPHMMPSSDSLPDRPATDALRDLLIDDEIVLIVANIPEMLTLLRNFLHDEGLRVHTAENACEMYRQLSENNVALVFLDIALPDADGLALLSKIKEEYANLAVVMLTAVADLQTALSCLRLGAEDYLTKPIHCADLAATLKRILEKRRLFLQNFHYQKEIERATFRLHLVNGLVMKLNTAFLSSVELDEILSTILVGITAEEGLQFNRAFLALLNDKGTVLEGRLAIGPGNREDGGRIWQDIRHRAMNFQNILAHARDKKSKLDAEVNRIVKALRIKHTETEHILIRALKMRKSINVVDGQCAWPVPLELLGLLQEDTFVIVPLFSTHRPLGVIIADHFVSRKPISEERIRDLESLALQGSLAIEQSHLHAEMHKKINELEEITRELAKNRNLLIAAERYAAIGQMAAHLAHSIRNPITAIGGTARLLARKTTNQEMLPFFKMMSDEVKKVEKTLEDLSNFAERAKPVCCKMPLLDLVRRSILLYFTAMEEQGIRYTLTFPPQDPVVSIDPRLIQQALVHLIRNSVEAMSSGGELSVEVRTTEREVEIILADTGYGLDISSLRQATEPFFTTKVAGIGMGLTLVKRIMEDHGGSLNLCRHEPKGTEIRLTLPLAE